MTHIRSQAFCYNLTNENKEESASIQMVCLTSLLQKTNMQQKTDSHTADVAAVFVSFLILSDM